MGVRAFNCFATFVSLISVSEGFLGVFFVKMIADIFDLHRRDGLRAKQMLTKGVSDSQKEEVGRGWGNSLLAFPHSLPLLSTLTLIQTWLRTLSSYTFCEK